MKDNELTKSIEKAIITCEQDLQDCCEQILKDLNIKFIHKNNSIRQKYRKNTNNNNPGQFDLIIFFPRGQCVCVELKIKPNKLSDIQLEWQKDMRNAEYRCYEINNTGEFVDLCGQYIDIL